MTAPTLAIPAPAPRPAKRSPGGCKPTSVQVWAVWAQDFDARVRVEVKHQHGWGWHGAEMAARMAGAMELRVKVSDVLARYVVTRRMR